MEIDQNMRIIWNHLKGLKINKTMQWDGIFLQMKLCMSSRFQKNYIEFEEQLAKSFKVSMS